MKSMRSRYVLILCALAVLLLGAGRRAWANGQGYTLDRWAVGGGRSSGGDYGLVGTFGQPNASVLSDGDYTLGGGFWGGGVVQYRIYLPLVMR
jgi:hypothetical protein